jgi:hypothetical protein
MGFGGRWRFVVLLLGTLLLAFEARAEGGRPLLVFDASAEGLPQREIRAEIERELGGALPTSAEAAVGELTVLVDTSHRLVVRYRTQRGALDRYLPMPNEPRDVSLIIALAVGNIVRDPSTSVPPRPEPPPRAPPRPPVAAPVEREAAPPNPGFPRHLFGFHVAQDVAIVGGSNVCDVNLGQKSDNFACFYSGTDDEPFWHTPYPYKDGVSTGPVLATTRLLVSYDFAFLSALSLGIRAGYAFGGGPPAGQTPVDSFTENLNTLPDHAKGEGGTPFLPAHLELRATVWVLPLGKRFSAYVGGAFGVAQVDAKSVIEERDCADTLSPEWDASNGTFDDCRNGAPGFDWTELQETDVDAWKKAGQGFAAASAGSVFWFADGLGAQLNLNAMLMFPASALVLEPSLGVVAALPSP